MSPEADVVSGAEQGPPDGSRQRVRRPRLVPPAVTPIRASDVAGAALDHARGRGLRAFRRDVVDRLDARSAASYTSFRRALGACLRALATSDPDRSTVLVPAFCSSDYPDAVDGVGLDLERYDVDRETLSLDLEAVERRLDDHDGDALALVVVNVLGYGSPMEAVSDLCEDRDVALVEALGYAMGTTYRGRPLGTFGDCAVLNFQEGKPVPVGGGMVVSRNPAVPVSDAGRPAVSPNVGAVAGYAALSRPTLYAGYDRTRAWLAERGYLSDRVTTHPGSKRGVAYEEPLATMSNFQGSLGRRILDRLPTHRRHRARTAQFYADALSGADGLELLEPVDGVENHQYVRFPVVAASAGLRDAAVGALADRGIGAAPLYGWPEIDGDAYPAARTLQERLFTLPTHPYVSATDRQVAVDAIHAVLGRR